MPFELLLVDLATEKPVLGQELALGSAASAPEPTRRDPHSLYRTDRLDDLEQQRWGVVVPRGERGEEMLTWLAPLVQLRREQCGMARGEKVPVYRIAPGMNRAEIRRWRIEVYEKGSRNHRRPRYLLLLGDLDQIPLELQQELMVSACVGRLCFRSDDGAADEAGYRDYVAKICAVEESRQDWSREPHFLFYSAHGDAQLGEGHSALMHRSFVTALNDPQFAGLSLRRFGRDGQPPWHRDGPDLSNDTRSAPLTCWAKSPQPGILLSMCHGAGVTDPDEQELRQGSLWVNRDGDTNGHEVVDYRFFRDHDFLPNGFWFLKACFGAATPAASAYSPWLEVLARAGLYAGATDLATRYLAVDRRPFVARLPQAALARMDGPLAILGHADLAWTYGYNDAIDGPETLEQKRAASPYYEVLRLVASGSRFGHAVRGLTDKASRVGTDLMWLYGQKDRAAANADQLRAWLWMQYLDLSGYILLGDPAAQLPIAAARDKAAHPAAAPAPTPTRPTVADSPAVDPRTVTELEEVFFPKPDTARLRHMAAKLQIDVSTLQNWLERYRRGGREALEIGTTADSEPD